MLLPALYLLLMHLQLTIEDCTGADNQQFSQWSDNTLRVAGWCVTVDGGGMSPAQMSDSAML